MEKSSLGFLHRYLPALAGQDVPHLPFARCTDGKHDAHSTHVSGDQNVQPRLLLQPGYLFHDILFDQP